MSVTSILSLITGGIGAIAVLGIVLTLIIGDNLHTDGEFKRLVEANAKKDEALEEAKRAIEAANARADAAVQAAEVIANALAGGGQRRPRVQK
jgi:hypothetical protein